MTLSSCTLSIRVKLVLRSEAKLRRKAAAKSLILFVVLHILMGEQLGSTGRITKLSSSSMVSIGCLSEVKVTTDRSEWYLEDGLSLNRR